MLMFANGWEGGVTDDDLGSLGRRTSGRCLSDPPPTPQTASPESVHRLARPAAVLLLVWEEEVDVNQMAPRLSARAHPAIPQIKTNNDESF